jgi:DNA polymerase III gamma/tau subunit
MERGRVIEFRAVTNRDNGANACYGGCVSLYILPRTRLLRLLANCDRANHSAQSWSRFSANEWRQHMKVFGVIGLTTLFLLLGTTVPAFAQEEHHDEGAKPAEHQEQAKPAKQEPAKPQKQEQAKPEKQQEQAKPQQQGQQAKTQEEHQQKNTEQQAKNQHEATQKQQQVKSEQNEEKNQQHQQQATKQTQQSQHQYAKNGQKDRSGHEYNESHFGPSHAARFEANGGRYYNGRREYNSGGYWFYASSYPPWFYQQNVFFVMGADGLWYAVAVNDPSLMFEVNIG